MSAKSGSAFTLLAVLSAWHVGGVFLQASSDAQAGRMGRYWDNIPYVLYNGRKMRFGEVHPTRGFQESIFNEEIRGAFIFGLSRLEELEAAFPGRLYETLTTHFTA